MKFTEENKTILGMTFGAHFHTNLTLTKRKGQLLYGRINRRFAGSFTAERCADDLPHIFLNQRKGSRLMVNDNNLMYSELANFDQQRFNQLCSFVMDNLIELYETERDNFRVLGKVYEYVFDFGTENAIEILQQRTGIFENEENLEYLSLKGKTTRDQLFIHLEISSVDTPEEELDPSKLVVKCDINNRDQRDFVNIEMLSNIFEFVDRYNREELLNFLNDKLGEA